MIQLPRHLKTRSNYNRGNEKKKMEVNTPYLDINYSIFITYRSCDDIFTGFVVFSLDVHLFIRYIFIDINL